MVYIIYGSRIHSGKIDGLNRIKRLFEDNNNTKLIVFATGATPSLAKHTIDTIWKTNFSEKELKQIPHFYMQSGLSYKKR